MPGAALRRLFDRLHRLCRPGRDTSGDYSVYAEEGVISVGGYIGPGFILAWAQGEERVLASKLCFTQNHFHLCLRSSSHARTSDPPFSHAQF